MRRLLLALVLVWPVTANVRAGTAGVNCERMAKTGSTYNIIFDLFCRHAKDSAPTEPDETPQRKGEAQFAIGDQYYFGRGLPQSYAEAAKFYRLAADQGHVAAQYFLGRMFQEGVGVPQNYAEAEKWYRLAAKQGDAFAQYALGDMYDRGQGVPQDDAEAVKWYRKAAVGGNTEAQSVLGRRFSRAAEQGNPDTQYNVGVFFLRGKFVPQDYNEAYKWFSKAAERSHAGAQSRLGVMYEYGLGVTKDYAQALRWYRKAAEQGDANAQHRLGAMYANGKGVMKDYAEAVKWYRLAAGQGNAMAQEGLGAMYKYGDSLPQDYVRAYAWYNLAATHHPGQHAEMMEGFSRASRDRIREKLTIPQIAEGQRLSRKLAAQIAARRNKTAIAPPPRGFTLDRAAQIQAPGAQSEHVSGASLAPPSRSAAGPSHDLVRRVQIGLKKSGYDPGPADGLSGRKTAAAVKAFQRKSGLPPTGEVSNELLALIVAAGKTRRKPSLRPVASGSGFVVSAAGDLLTNFHVVKDCAAAPAASLDPLGIYSHVTVSTSGNGKATRATVTATDKVNDLAALKLPAPLGQPESGLLAVFHSNKNVARFRAYRRARLGESIMVAGFPLKGLLSQGLNVTTGTVTAMAGIGDDARMLQISAPVQAGNSGGPLLDASGNVVGIVVSKLKAVKVRRLTGDLAQNVNFAIKGAVVRSFLDIHGIEYQTARSTGKLDTAAIAEKARGFTVAVECWK